MHAPHSMAPACAASLAEKVARDTQAFAHAAAACPPARSASFPEVVLNAPDAAVADEMSDVQVDSIVANIHLQTTHAPQLPAASPHVAPPEKGYICNHCCRHFVCIMFARKHHQRCTMVRLAISCQVQAMPCQAFKGATCDRCFVGKRYCDCDRCIAVQPYCATRRPRQFDEAAAAAAAETFRAAEETLHRN